MQRKCVKVIISFYGRKYGTHAFLHSGFLTELGCPNKRYFDLLVQQQFAGGQLSGH